jgi:putative ABC transport system substrate-binding protein
MRENGMRVGKQYVLDERYADGNYERFPKLTDELLKRNPAVILVNTIASVRVAQQATETVPIVFVSTNDPVGSGLVASLARPGGNTTGLSNQAEDTVTKLVEILHEVLPRATRVAALFNPGNPSNPKLFEELRASAIGFGITACAFEAASPEGGHLREENPRRGEARRPPRRAAYQVRAGDQLEDRQGPRACDPAVRAGAG